MTKAEKKHEPVRQSVHVDCPIEDAFRLFTERFGEWWPGVPACEMEPWPGGRVFERTRSREERDWGAVLDWDPPAHLRFSYAPGGTVDVDFRVEADGTRVTLIHTGWEATAAPSCALRFANFVGAQTLVCA